jgi:hypothetical protein
MNQIYVGPYNWPQPYQYQLWYHQLAQEQQSSVIDPQFYTQVYTYALQNEPSLTQNPKKAKLSRNQKRRVKKQ